MTPEATRLRLVPDSRFLENDLQNVASHTWGRLRTQTQQGEVGPEVPIDWRVLSLRSPGGDGTRTDPGNPGPVDFADTEWRQKMPYLDAFLNEIPAPLNSVRLMSLAPGVTGAPHSDDKYRLELGFVRLHIPVVTNPQAVLVLDGIEHRWQPGTVWYGDFSRVHHVRNEGPTSRVHVVIDALLTEPLASLFPPDWQGELAHSGLYNRQIAPVPPRPPDILPATVSAPAGFMDFNSDEVLAGAPRRVSIYAKGDVVFVTISDRPFALTAISEKEYRFAGWSDQRTMVFDDNVVHFIARSARSVDRHTAPVEEGVEAF